MIRQRPGGSAPAVQALAEMLPFEADSFDCALAVLTVHHWVDPLAGLRELRRVARKRVVVLTWDQNLWERFWLVAEYLPALALFDRCRAIPLELIISVLGSCEVRPVTVPYDCLDGFLGAYWRRPSAYLNANIRAVMSGFAQVPTSDYEEGIRRLAADLETGTWQKNHRDLLQATTADLGYRLIVADKRPRFDE
jgi:SAM-dependent methyltransferase